VKVPVMPVGARLLGTMLAFVLAGPQAIFAQPPAPSSEGSGASHWGTIPAREDSVTARFEDAPRPRWEIPFAATWWLATRPFALAREGTRGSVAWLEDSGALATVRRWLAPIDLPYGFSVSGAAGGLSGVGAGLAFYHDEFLGPENRLRLKVALSSRNDRRLTGGLIVPLSDASELEVGAGYRRRGRARYFGLGPFTRYEDEAYFTQESFWGGAILEQRLGVGSLALKGRALYTTLDSRGPIATDEDDPSVEEAFGADLPTGYGDRSDGWVLGLALESATADENGRPRAGGLQRAQAAYFRPDREGEASFVTYRLESQNFFDLWWDRALAVRGSWSWIEDGGEDVHFQRLMTNDEPDLLRGYDDFRWRDTGFTALTVEYRYPVWDYRDPGQLTVDAYSFYDTGQVFGHRREIALQTLTHSYGLGFRLSSRGGFVGRLEVGFSEEDTVIRLRADQIFQFDKQGLYHGREPIPLR
jgi:hypothetical protein